VRLAEIADNPVKFQKTSTAHFYAGFNVWENETSTQRITGAASGKLEIKMFENQGALSPFASSLLSASLLIVFSVF